MNNKCNDEGQSTIEFLMTFIISTSFLFLFIKIALNFTDGFLVNYANFMTSRAYLVYDTGVNLGGGAAGVMDAPDEIRQVWNKYYVSRLMPDTSFSLKIVAPGQNNPYVGTYVEYTEYLSYLKIVGGKKEMTLRSESFLGKETTRQDCQARVCAAIAGASAAGYSSCELYSTIFDNGC